MLQPAVQGTQQAYSREYDATMRSYGSERVTDAAQLGYNCCKALSCKCLRKCGLYSADNVFGMYQILGFW